ncbi:MAG: hypothetical protein L0Y76_05220, partial [Ignavibacteria bacterium]|nr:hypothetical protein [Ignavibacteria bacterium]
VTPYNTVNIKDKISTLSLKSAIFCLANEIYVNIINKKYKNTCTTLSPKSNLISGKLSPGREDRTKIPVTRNKKPK